MGESTLHVWTNGTDSFVARDLDHLAALYLEHTGLKLTDEDALGEDGEWSQVPDDRPIKVHFEDAEEGFEKETHTAAQWAARGEGFLCSTEF